MGSGIPPTIPGPPSALEELLVDGKVLADDGHLYRSVVTAYENATEAIFVGRGRFDEALEIDQSDFTLKGLGSSLTDINGGSSPGVTVAAAADNVTIEDVTIGSEIGGSAIGFRVKGKHLTARNINVFEAGDHGIRIDENDQTFTNINVNGQGNSHDIGGIGIFLSGQGSGVANQFTTIQASHCDDDGFHIITPDEMVLNGLDARQNGRHGLVLGCDDSTFEGLIIANNDNNGVRDAGTDNIVSGRSLGNGTDLDSTNATGGDYANLKTGT